MECHGTKRYEFCVPASSCGIGSSRLERMTGLPVWKSTSHAYVVRTLLMLCVCTASSSAVNAMR